MNDINLLEYAPDKMQKEAERMAANLDWKKKEKICFLLVGTQIPKPVECVWLDPSLGMFQIEGKEDAGFMMIRQLPAGTIILNQRIEGEEN